MTNPTRSRRRAPVLWRTAAAAALALALLTPATAALAEGDDDPNLDQTLDDLPVVQGERVLDAGHVDMGPKFVDGQWRFLIHDDAARADANASSVWRYPEQTVLHVRDQAELTVPDDQAYEFIGAAPGEPVWVIPQTQNPEVVWLGWNTQDPEVMSTIDRGITLSLTGVQGPGIATVYLQSGSFGEPQLLWDSRVTDAQPAWVDVNTHTHANWVFTEPGVYLLRLQADADLVDGTSASDTQYIRVAVGTDTDPADALAASWEGAAEPEPDAETGADAEEEATETPAAAPEDDADPLVPILIGVIALVAASLIVGFTVAIVRGNRAKKRILAARASTPQTESDDDARGEERR
ncbi:choice-of-anchor M domain-containing protein [Microbacterium marinilacus]|uniref:Surface-anchored protein n=1 Tax=Microbacterium marinilacus TaxID=415209 RepID=A0ABP7BJX2_9MICO|nr:choice-of-anchor M domain-containing protein [Microbacterium marinilacus]MBY0687664.1 choice-of-anchor M domain-containing protein [Microbacterium marinilacus]